MTRFVFIGCSLVGMGCGGMQDAFLYKADLTPTAQERVLTFPHRQIFMDEDNSTMFGLKEHPCKRIEFVEENSIEGDNHLAIEWSQNDDCNYLGVGFPWAQYAGKNLQSIEGIAAIQFHLRLDTGSVSKVPMLFSLVDYGGNQAYAKINLLNVEGQKLDDTWRKVHLPLLAFKAASKGVNLKNIKELRIEFQREGFVHLDAIQLVPFRHEAEVLASRGSVCQGFPIPLDSTKLSWGLNGESGTAKWVDDGLGSALELDYDGTNDFKGWDAFGIALNEWEALDMSALYRASALTFELHGQWTPLTFAIWSTHGTPRKIQKVLSDEHCIQTLDDVWQCALPIKGFGQFDRLEWGGTREVRVTMKESTQTRLCEFKWEEYRGNPSKPELWLERRMR